MLLMRCDGCQKWTTTRITRYGNGAEIENWRAPEGKGRCSELDIDTPAAFGCTAFQEMAPANSPHVVSNWKNGAPWQHWVPGPCPDCSGVGSQGTGGACGRCVGIGKVQYHDDGYISDNHTKIHPMERGKVDPLRCKTCGETVEVRWKACPICGTRLEPVAETEIIGGFGNAGGAFRSNKEERVENLRQEIDAMNEEDAKLAGLTPVGGMVNAARAAGILGG